MTTEELIAARRAEPWREALRKSKKNKERTDIPRVEMNELDAEYRSHTRLEEVNLGLTKEQAIQEAIATLPEKCREVFVLSKIEGLKNREIAEKLNISEKTVERHMSIALSKLREELDWLLQIILFFSFSHWG